MGINKPVSCYSHVFIHHHVKASLMMEYCTVIKRKGLLIHAITWKTFKCIRPGDRSQTQGLHTLWFHLYAILERQNHRSRKQISECQAVVMEAEANYKGAARRNLGDDIFISWLWEQLDCMDLAKLRDYTQPVNLKEINPEFSLEGLLLKLKLQYFGHLMRRAGKDPVAGKDWGGRRWYG